MDKLFLALRYIVSLVHIIYGFLAILVCHLMWGRRLFWCKNALFTVIKPDSWPMNEKKWLGGWFKGWGGVTLAPYSIMLAGSEGGMNTVVAARELRHVDQMVMTCAAFLIPAIVVAIVSNVFLGLAIWTLAPALTGIGSYFEVSTRSKELYRDNINEEDARAAAKDIVWQNLDDVLDGKISK